MKKLTVLLGALAVSACTLNGVTLDPSRSTQNIAPAYLMLTPDEQNIWAGLTDAQRERGILFIKNGASLVSSLGSQ